MALISTEEIKPGMVLEKDVKNGHGQVLLRAGAEVTERHLTLIRSWGVTEAVVKGNSNARLDLLEIQDIKPEVYARAEAALRPRFHHAGLSDPVMGELFRYCAARKAKSPHFHPSHPHP